MFQIRIIGLGPGTEKFLTSEAIGYIEDEYPNFVRTEHHESVSYFKEHGIDFRSFDALYEELNNFSSVYETIAQTLIDEAQASPVNYFVPGDPLIAEEAVQILLRTYDNVKIVHGVSFIEPILGLVNSDPVNGLKIIDGDSFSYLDFDPLVDTIITQVYNQRILSELKIAIGDVYGDEYKVWLISNAGMSEMEDAIYLSSYELDRGYEIGIKTSIFIPRGHVKDRYTMRELMNYLDKVEAFPSQKTLMQSLIKRMEAFEKHFDVDDPYLREENLAKILSSLMTLCYRDIKDGYYSMSDLTSDTMKELISASWNDEYRI